MMVQSGITNHYAGIQKGKWYKVDTKKEDGYSLTGHPHFIYNEEVADYSFMDDLDHLSIRNEPHGITGVKHSIEKAPAKPTSVLLDIDIFRKASQMVMETSSHASSIHTLDSLEKEMKRQTASLCESLKDILNNDPDYYGHCSVGTLNYRISFLWMDENTVELDISIHPEMKDGMIVETDIESIMEQL